MTSKKIYRVNSKVKSRGTKPTTPTPTSCIVASATSRLQEEASSQAKPPAVVLVVGGPRHHDKHGPWSHERLIPKGSTVAATFSEAARQGP